MAPNETYRARARAPPLARTRAPRDRGSQLDEAELALVRIAAPHAALGVELGPAHEDAGHRVGREDLARLRVDLAQLAVDRRLAALDRAVPQLAPANVTPVTMRSEVMRFFTAPVFGSTLKIVLFL